MLPFPVLLTTVAFLVGIPTAWAWGKYLHHFHAFHENQAGMWDTIIVWISFALTITLWHASGDNVAIPLAYGLGNGIGTKFVVRHNKRKQVVS